MKIGENMKKLMLVGIGAAALTEEKLENVIHDLTRKGEFTEEEGKKAFEELRSKLKESKGDLRKMVENVTEKVISGMNLVRREELEALEKRIAALEASDIDSRKED